jgi:hypothetical protein
VNEIVPQEAIAQPKENLWKMLEGSRKRDSISARKSEDIKREGLRK